MATARFAVRYYAWILLVMLMCPSWAVAQQPNPLTAPLFSDPGRVVSMPEEWVAQSPPRMPGQIRVDLSLELYRILKSPLQEYARELGIEIILENATCGTSAGKLRKKLIDIGSFCCPAGALDRLPGLRFHTLGITGIALFVHPDNPTREITLAQARALFGGELFEWSELHASALPEPAFVMPVARLHCKTRPGHGRLLLDNENLFSPRLEEVGTVPDMISKVANRREAIGHASVWLARDYYTDRGRVAILALDSARPDDIEALASGRYPLYKTLIVTTWSGDRIEHPMARPLVDFMTRYIEEHGARLGVAPARELRAAGWRFRDQELVGKPE